MQHHTNDITDFEEAGRPSDNAATVDGLMARVIEALQPNGGMYDDYKDSIIVLEVKADNNPGFKIGKIILGVADLDDHNLEGVELYQDGITETVELILEELKANGYAFIPSEVADMIAKIEDALVLENTDLQAIKEAMSDAFPEGEVPGFTVRIQFTITKDMAVLVTSGWLTWIAGMKPKHVSDMSGVVLHHAERQSQVWARGMQSLPKEI